MKRIWKSRLGPVGPWLAAPGPMKRYGARAGIWIVSPVLMLVLASPAQATTGIHHRCSESGPLAVGTSLTVGNLFCSVRISCPATATQCQINATGQVKGLGIVGAQVAAFPGTGGSCRDVVTCAITIVNIVILDPGESASIFCYFGAPPELTVAARVTIWCDGVSFVS